MGDLALITVFFSMIFFPCGIAMRSVRARKPRAVGNDSSRLNTIHAVADAESAEEYTYSRLEPRHDRRALALQRSRDLYYRERARRAAAIAKPAHPSFTMSENARPVLVDKKVG